MKVYVIEPKTAKARAALHVKVQHNGLEKYPEFNLYMCPYTASPNSVCLSRPSLHPWYLPHLFDANPDIVEVNSNFAAYPSSYSSPPAAGSTSMAIDLVPNSVVLGSMSPMLL
jgi:hypothetical protein